MNKNVRKFFKLTIENDPLYYPNFLNGEYPSRSFKILNEFVSENSNKFSFEISNAFVLDIPNECLIYKIPIQILFKHKLPQKA